jgi:hypothetical protein
LGARAVGGADAGRAQGPVKVSSGDDRPLRVVKIGDQTYPDPIARFSAYVEGQRMVPHGDMKLQLGVPYPQVPNVMPLMQHVGGQQFEITVRRVPREELPEPGW